MAKVLVLYYSAYGHIETMANAVAEGAKSAGADVVVKRVPELVLGRRCQGIVLQGGSGRTDRNYRRTGGL